MLQVAIFIVSLVNLRFETNDDTTIVALAAAGYGSASEYLINVNILVGYITKFLFSEFPSVNWITIIFILFNAISILVLNYILLASTRDLLDKFICGGVLVVSCILFFSYFTFTTVGYLSGIAGVLCLFVAEYEEAIKKILFTLWVSY